MQMVAAQEEKAPGNNILPKEEFSAGVFLIDKPAGPSSFKIVQRFRRVLGIKKVGHAGTLDPFASGLLIVCAGRPATRIIDQLMAGEKEYEATIRLGVATDTQDLEGEVVETRPVPGLDQDRIESCLEKFVGEQLQTPPKYSALKHKGKPLYYYARRGIDVVKEARPVEIKKIDCLEAAGDLLRIRVVCSKGTYIRTLAADIGEALGCCGHLLELRRTRSGVFKVSEAMKEEALGNGSVEKDAIISHALSVAEALANI